MTLRVAEEEVEAEEDLVTPEAPSNPRIGVEVEATRMSITNGMPLSPLALVEGDQPIVRLKGHGGTLIIVVVAITPPKKDPRTGTTRIFPLTTLKNLMIRRRGPEAPAPEIIDIGEKEALKDIILEENIMMRAENPIGIMGPAQVGGNTAQPEETKIMIDMVEETRAQDIGLALDLDTRGKTHQVKAGDTLVTTGDGDAKGP